MTDVLTHSALTYENVFILNSRKIYLTIIKYMITF